MEPFRLRLKFDDSVLSDSQKSDGLTRSWFLVQPEHRSISDLVTCLLNAFHLWDSCPHGVFLSVEGFGLPHFESIAILDNADLVCVKRKGSKLCLEQKADLGKPVLASGDFEKEVGGSQNECEEEDKDMQTDILEEENIPNGDASIKKRKASKQMKNSKKKRKCKKQNMSSHKEHSDSCLQNGYCHKKSPNSKQDQVHTQGCSNVDSWEGIVSLSSEPDETVRASTSRSSRRKNIQRKRRHVAEQLHKKKSQGEDLDEDEITPVVVQPRHIRFTSPEKGKEVQQYQGAEELPNWRGITNNLNKKKWGKDKESPSNLKQETCKWNENRSPQEKQSGSAWGGSRSWKSGVKWNEFRNRGRNWTAKKAAPTDPLKEYEKLLPLTDFPLEGDVIAYRLLDISSSLCPVMTSYRVGKVVSCEPKTNLVVLVPVPEYPFEFKKAGGDTCNEPADASRYKEDGSLEIDFPSLADVRVVRRGPSASGWKSNSGLGCWTPTASDSGWLTENVVPGSSQTNTDFASTSENGGGDVWEEIIAAVRAKEAEEAKEDNWNKKQKRANYTWIYRTVRRQAATAPNMRPQN